MTACGKEFIDEIQRILTKRKRRLIEDLPFPHAAVLVPLFEKEGNCHILFTKRTDQVKHHKGEISFPGGVFDQDDVDLKMTALREAFEEIGLRENDVQVFGILDDIVTISDFIVTPFVGLFPYPYPFNLSAIEIAELIEVPVQILLDEKSFGEREIIKEDQNRIVYAYQYGKHIIWGATARILKQLLDLLPSK